MGKTIGWPECYFDSYQSLALNIRHLEVDVKNLYILPGPRAAGSRAVGREVGRGPPFSKTPGRRVCKKKSQRLIFPCSSSNTADCNNYCSSMFGC